jgi:hypothetical protein
VIGRLRLSGAQQRQIRRIIDATTGALRQLDLEASREGVQRRDVAGLREELLDKSRRDALDVLTSEQRAQWDKLLQPAQPNP